MSFLSQLSSSVYRLAYDYAVETLGLENGHKLFPMLSSMSLCSIAPAESFTHLCLRLASAIQKCNPGDTPNINFIELLNELPLLHYAFPHPYYHGEHPVYGDIVRALYVLNARKEFDYLRYWAAPFDLGKSLVDASLPPLLFNTVAGSNRIVMRTPSRMPSNADSVCDPNPSEVPEGMMILVWLHELSTRLSDYVV